SAQRTKLAAGHTVPDVPIATNRSQSRSPCFAAHSASGGISSPNSTTDGRISIPQHSGGAPPGRPRPPPHTPHPPPPPLPPAPPPRPPPPPRPHPPARLCA